MTLPWITPPPILQTTRTRTTSRLFLVESETFFSRNKQLENEKPRNECDEPQLKKLPPTNWTYSYATPGLPLEEVPHITNAHFQEKIRTTPPKDEPVDN